MTHFSVSVAARGLPESAVDPYAVLQKRGAYVDPQTFIPTAVYLVDLEGLDRLDPSVYGKTIVSDLYFNSTYGLGDVCCYSSKLDLPTLVWAYCFL